VQCDGEQNRQRVNGHGLNDRCKVHRLIVA
jgi:hypothetical protein